MNLQPQGYFTIVRQIANHLDTDTNYVRAVIRNAFTDATIDTLNLTDKGSQRFKKDWLVPADPSGQGFYISIITSVYSDSGYTTKNSSYGDEENTYLVQERVLNRHAGGGVDAYTVRQIVRQELDKLPKPDIIEFPQQKDPIDRTDEIIRAIEANKPKIKETDLKPIISKLDAIAQAVQEKEITPVTDLTPVQSDVQAIKGAVAEGINRIVTVVTGIENTVAEKAAAAVKEEMNNVSWESTYTTAGKKGEKPQATRPEQKPVPFNLEQLAL